MKIADYFNKNKLIGNRECDEMKETYLNVLDALPDGVYITDADTKALYMNAVCFEDFGLTDDEVMGRASDELVKDGTFSESVSSLVKKRKKRSSVLQALKGKPVLVTGTPIFNENGDIILIVTATRDITELNHLNSDLEYERQLKDQYYNEMISLKAIDMRRIEGALKDVRSKNMYEVVQLALQVAKTDSTVLIQGESGVGKDVVAHLICNESLRSDKPFIKINCATIPENLLESELFGYEEGAFTGAKKGGKAGLIETAYGGTIFLDEIGEMPLALQPKLLQMIQEKTFLRVGGTEPKEANVRIIAATNRDLHSLVKENKFRADLYYRLNVIPINIKPLRERIEDIPFLVHSFLERFNKEYDRNKVFSHETIEILVRYSWPGNVRELENLIERMVVIGMEDLILPEQLPEIVRHDDSSNQVMVSGVLTIDEATEELEKQLYIKAYEMTKSSYKAAKILGVNQSTVVRKLQKYGRVEID